MAAIDRAGLTLERAQALGADVLAQVFARYGRPLDVAAPLERSVDLASSTIGTISYRSPVDVIANDWFVLVTGEERVAIAAPMFTALVDRLAAR